MNKKKISNHFWSNYSLKLVEIEILKIYIETNLVNDFI